MAVGESALPPSAGAADASPALASHLTAREICSNAVEASIVTESCLIARLPQKQPINRGELCRRPILRFCRVKKPRAAGRAGRAIAVTYASMKRNSKAKSLKCKRYRASAARRRETGAAIHGTSVAEPAAPPADRPPGYGGDGIRRHSRNENSSASAGIAGGRPWRRLTKAAAVPGILRM